MYSAEEDLIIQSYFTIAFLAELNNNNFLRSNAYKEMNFQDSYIKANLPSIGIGNHGTIIQTLYSILVLPKELISNKFPKEFSDLNVFLKLNTVSAQTTYNADSINIDYLRHIRNSVAHGKVSFENDLVVFNDINSRTNEICEIKITLQNFGLFIGELQKIFLAFIEYLKNKK
ncbi:HEPN family nuclease [Flavobacterium saccharophilum]|uniref:pEK499-p136 HEPN domain-containing protein n=1 Tax=Flavobacterium saccharophilum TaxID=29534 RepID=A0A1M6ZLA6_9FLAO|nr:HEPN family nuclease [Flavobacterium saccharophilum]SHL31252.1 hypothetical protein SAMN05444366_0315 [Flavobacterium saccharophilum]